MCQCPAQMDVNVSTMELTWKLLTLLPRTLNHAQWFLGKYSLVGFEIFILILSTAALTYGRRVMSTKIEIASHVTCVVIGVAAFIGYYASAWRIYKEG